MISKLPFRTLMGTGVSAGEVSRPDDTRPPRCGSPRLIRSLRFEVAAATDVMNPLPTVAYWRRKMLAAVLRRRPDATMGANRRGSGIDPAPLHPRWPEAPHLTGAGGTRPRSPYHLRRGLPRQPGPVPGDPRRPAGRGELEQRQRGVLLRQEREPHRPRPGNRRNQHDRPAPAPIRAGPVEHESCCKPCSSSTTSARTLRKSSPI